MKTLPDYILYYIDEDADRRDRCIPSLTKFIEALGDSISQMDEDGKVWLVSAVDTDLGDIRNIITTTFSTYKNAIESLIELGTIRYYKPDGVIIVGECCKEQSGCSYIIYSDMLNADKGRNIIASSYCSCCCYID